MRQPGSLWPAGRRTAWPVLVTHAVLRMFGPATRSERGLLVGAYACTVGASLAAMLIFNPATSGCATCPANPLLLLSTHPPMLLGWSTSRHSLDPSGQHCSWPRSLIG